ncbi:MAG: hypothetical protein ACMUIE_10680 [Thermoplasmatota archaeon]
MLKEVLLRIAKGGSSIENISSSLGVSPGEIETAIEQLLRLGYLKEVRSEIKECQPSTCPHCPLRQGCTGGGRSKTYPRILEVTEKGESALGQHPK